MPVRLVDDDPDCRSLVRDAGVMLGAAAVAGAKERSYSRSARSPFTAS